LDVLPSAGPQVSSFCYSRQLSLLVALPPALPIQESCTLAFGVPFANLMLPMSHVLLAMALGFVQTDLVMGD
jgi:hypothetical protein